MVHQRDTLPTTVSSNQCFDAMLKRPWGDYCLGREGKELS